MTIYDDDAIELTIPDAMVAEKSITVSAAPLPDSVAYKVQF